MRRFSAIGCPRDVTEPRLTGLLVVTSSRPSTATLSSPPRRDRFREQLAVSLPRLVYAALLLWMAAGGAELAGILLRAHYLPGLRVRFTCRCVRSSVCQQCGRSRGGRLL